MNTLSELKEYFTKNNVKITENGGWYFKVGTDMWSMFDGNYYLNLVKYTSKLTEYVPSSKIPRKAIKITANKGEEDVGTCN